MERVFLYGHTHPEGYTVSDADIKTYFSMYKAKPNWTGIILEKNKQGDVAAYKIEFWEGREDCPIRVVMILIYH